MMLHLSVRVSGRWLVAASLAVAGCDAPGGGLDVESGAEASLDSATGVAQDASGGAIDPTSSGDVTSGANESDESSGSELDDADTGPNDGPIQLLGDSVFAWERDAQLDIGSWIAKTTKMPVINNAEGNASILVDDAELASIPNQYENGTWSWVVIDGGANDFGEICGTREARETLDRIVTEDAMQGALVELVKTIVADDALVVLAAYYRVPEESEFGACELELALHRERLRALADRHSRIVYVDMGDAIDFDRDPSDYDGDLIHPSSRGTEKIGRLIGDIIVQFGRLTSSNASKRHFD